MHTMGFGFASTLIHIGEAMKGKKKKWNEMLLWWWRNGKTNGKMGIENLFYADFGLFLFRIGSLLRLPASHKKVISIICDCVCGCVFVWLYMEDSIPFVRCADAGNKKKFDSWHTLDWIFVVAMSLGYDTERTTWGVKSAGNTLSVTSNRGTKKKTQTFSISKSGTTMMDCASYTKRFRTGLAKHTH